MVGEPCAPGTSGGGKAQTPMHHHLLEVHFGGVALMMERQKCARYGVEWLIWYDWYVTGKLYPAYTMH